MRRGRSLGFALPAVALASAAVAPVALGCSCALPDPRRALTDADAAFVGTLLDRRDSPPGPGGVIGTGDPAYLRFRVDEVLKGPLGSEVEVVTARSGATCGLEVSIGQRVGLYVHASPVGWRGGLCEQVSPEVMRSSDDPLPKPAGRGQVAALAVGTYGSATVVALDRRGRVLGYGAGGTPASAVSICPGSRRSVELSLVPGAAGGLRSTVTVRDLASLRAVRRWTVSNRTASAVVCRGPAGADVVVNLGYALARSTPAGLLVIHRWRPNAEATLSRTHAYAIAGQRVVAVDLRSGTERTVARLPRDVPGVTPSPRGRRFAGIATKFAPRRPPKAWLVVTDRTGVRRMRLPAGTLFATPVWLDDSRVALVGYDGPVGAPVFDVTAGLRLVARIPGARGASPARVSDAIWTLIQEPSGRHRVRVLRARIAGGGGSTGSTFDTPGIRLLIAVPAGPSIERVAITARNVRAQSCAAVAKR